MDTNLTIDYVEEAGTVLQGDITVNNKTVRFSVCFSMEHGLGDYHFKWAMTEDEFTSKEKEKVQDTLASFFRSKEPELTIRNFIHVFVEDDLVAKSPGNNKLDKKINKICSFILNDRHGEGNWTSGDYEYEELSKKISHILYS